MEPGPGAPPHLTVYFDNNNIGLFVVETVIFFLDNSTHVGNLIALINTRAAVVIWRKRKKVVKKKNEAVKRTRAEPLLRVTAPLSRNHTKSRGPKGKMPRRKQSNPQPVKLGTQESENGTLVVDPSCLVLESDFLLSGELEFGDLDRDAGVTVFSLSVEDDPSVPTDPSFPGFVSCKRCGKLLGDSPLAAGLDLGVGLDLSSELYCLDCDENVHLSLSQTESENLPDRSSTNRKRRRRVSKPPSQLKLFSCSLCSFSSRYSNHLKRHMRIHEGQKPYRCGVCTYASTQLVNLQRHTRTHTGEKPYRCQLCSYACGSHGNLQRHQRTHTQLQQQKSERRRTEEKRRQAQTEEVVSNVTLTVSQKGFLQTLGALGAGSPLPALLFPLCCRKCGLTLEDDELQAERGDGDSEGQVCRRCSPESDSSSGRPPAASHSRRSSKLYRCPLCPFLSHYPNHLSRHIHTHNAHKPHRCPHCPYTSSHLDNLKRHLRIHTGEKPYSCSSCSYACGNLANLRRHERVHTGAKPFTCPVCGYSCNQSMNLKRHMLRHTGHKPYACHECSYTTGHWDNYKRHQKKHGHNTDNWEKSMYTAQISENTGLNTDSEAQDAPQGNV